MKTVKLFTATFLIAVCALVVGAGQGLADKHGKIESRSAEWGKDYPDHYKTFLDIKKSDDIDDMLKKEPALVVLWAGYGFAKDYNAPRGHAYALEDNINTLRTGGPVDAKSGPMPTACWTCKSPDVPRLMKEKGDLDYFTGKWARWGSEVANTIGCADCHEAGSMDLKVSRAYVQRGVDAEGSLKFAKLSDTDMRNMVCAQCHSEYYFKKTAYKDDQGNEKTAAVVTFPWDNGFTAEQMEEYYDQRNFVDWTHKLSKAPMLKAQHPGYETFITGAHGQNGVSCPDCHMPTVGKKGDEFTSHTIGSPLDNIEQTCMSCHEKSKEEFAAIVDEKRARKDELSRKAMQSLAKAHLEAAKAWEVGATEAEMKPALQDIRHAQWRWDYSIAAHGSFFHAPEETLRGLGSALDKAQEARVKLRMILAKHGAGDFVAPDFSDKKKAQEIIGLPYKKLVDEKMTFLKGLRKEWIEESKKKNLYDPDSAEGIKFKTSYK